MENWKSFKNVKGEKWKKWKIVKAENWQNWKIRKVGKIEKWKSRKGKKWTSVMDKLTERQTCRQRDVHTDRQTDG